MNANMNRFNVLVALFLTDAVVQGWMGIWWIKCFAPLLPAKTISVNDILSAALGIVFMYVIIRKYEKPSVGAIIISGLVSYLSLFALMISPSVFVLVSTFMGVWMVSLVRVFGNNLIAENIQQSERASFDNHVALMRNIGLIVGGCIAFFTVPTERAYWKVWIAIFIAFDTDLIIRVILIRTGFFYYKKT